MALTAVVQSSSITTSVIIPLVGAGVLTMEQIYPYTLGANIGTTITALLAVLALDTGKEAAMTIAICHLLFNVFGIALLYPLKALPIGTARWIASFVSAGRKATSLCFSPYILQLCRTDHFRKIQLRTDIMFRDLIRICEGTGFTDLSSVNFSSMLAHSEEMLEICPQGHRQQAQRQEIR
jgi:hypothetical protein